MYAKIELSRNTLPEFVRQSRYGYTDSTVPKHHGLHVQLLKHKVYKLLISLMHYTPHYFTAHLYINKAGELLKLKCYLNIGYMHMHMATQVTHTGLIPEVGVLAVTPDAGDVLYDFFLETQAHFCANCNHYAEKTNHLIPVIRPNYDLSGDIMQKMIQTRYQPNPNTAARFYVPSVHHKTMCDTRNIESMTTDEYFDYLFDTSTPTTEPQPQQQDLIFHVQPGVLVYNHTRFQFVFAAAGSIPEVSNMSTKLLVFSKARQDAIDILIREVSVWFAECDTRKPLVIVVADIWVFAWSQMLQGWTYKLIVVLSNDDWPATQDFDIIIISENVINSAPDASLLVVTTKLMMHPLVTVMYNCSMPTMSRVINVLGDILGPFVILTSEASNDPRYLTQDMRIMLRNTVGSYQDRTFADMLSDISRAMDLNYRSKPIEDVIALRRAIAGYNGINIAPLLEGAAKTTIRISKTQVVETTYHSEYVPEAYFKSYVTAIPNKQQSSEIDCQSCGRSIWPEDHDFGVLALGTNTIANCIHCHAILGRTLHGASYYKSPLWAKLTPKWGPMFEWLLYENIVVRLENNNTSIGTKKRKGYLIYSNGVTQSDVQYFSNIVSGASTNVRVYYVTKTTDVSVIDNDIESILKDDIFAVIFATSEPSALKVFNLSKIIETVFMVNYSTPMGCDWPDLGSPYTQIVFAFVGTRDFYDLDESTVTTTQPQIATRSGNIRKTRIFTKDAKLNTFAPIVSTQTKHILQISEDTKRRLIAMTLTKLSWISDEERNHNRPDRCTTICNCLLQTTQ